VPRADGALVLGPERERVERVPAHRVLVGDLVQVPDWDIRGYLGKLVGSYGQEESECG
jgi:hypothetical protein